MGSKWSSCLRLLAIRQALQPTQLSDYTGCTDSPEAIASMSGLINKVKNAAGGYKDDETGKTGIGGIAADGQKTFKNYKTDAADGSVDWKKQAGGVAHDLKTGLGGHGGAPPPQ